MKNMMHYNGFVDTCVAYGINKEAAARLYKESGWIGSGLRFLGRGLGRLFNAGVATKNVAQTAGRATIDTASRAGRATVDAATRAGRATAEAARQAGRSVKTNVGAGFHSVVPTKKMVTPRAITKDPGPGFWSNVGHLMNPLTYTKPVVNFVGKHPVIGSLGLVGGTAYATNLANATGANDSEYSKVPALTPSQRRTVDRMNSGMNLPGLGLDPMYFNGSYY